MQVTNECAFDRSETTTLMVSYDTPLESIEQLKSRLQAYAADNSREWSNISLNIDKMDYQNAIYLTIAMERKYLIDQLFVIDAC